MKINGSARPHSNLGVLPSPKGKAALAGLFGLALLALPRTASAFDFALKLEPGFAAPLSAPQSERFNAGGSAGLKMMLGLGRFVDVEAGSLFVGLPSGNAYTAIGTAWAFGGGFRLKRPHDAKSAGGMSPWIDADAYFLRTGPLDRFAFDVAVGLAFPVDQNRRFWIGPFVRYLQIAQPGSAGSDDRDAKILIAGVSLETTVAHLQMQREEDMPPACAAPAAVETPGCPECAVCPSLAISNDRDNDGVIDSLDYCPDVPGPIENFGCPDYGVCKVQKDKIVLNELIFFAWDKDLIEERSFGLLDTVVKVLTDNKSFHVRVEGNTDSTGAEAHNQALSEGRAAAVVKYLVDRGIQTDRVASKGFASSQPTESNTTVAGRADNRRVDFVILSRDGSVK